MKADDIIAIIDELPRLIVYFLPGLLFLKIYDFISPTKESKEKTYYIYCIVTSYIIINIGKIISKLKLGYADEYTSEFIIGITILSIILGYGIGRFMNSGFSIRMLRAIKINKTNNLSIFADIKDAEYGTWLKVYMRDDNIVYSGALREFEHTLNYDNAYILLSDYITYLSNKESKFDERLLNKNAMNNKWAAIRVKDILRIEIEYDKKSKKII